MSLLKSLNSVVQGGHHLHLELEVLLRSQRRRHRDPGPLGVLTLVVLPLLIRTTPGVHHLILDKRFHEQGYCRNKFRWIRYFLRERLGHDEVDRIEWTVLTPMI